MKITPHNSFIPIVKMKDKSNTSEALKDAAEGFETLLTHQMVEELQKDLEGESMFGGGVEGNTIGAMAEWELASQLSKSLDFGILQQLQASVAAEKEDK